MLKADTQPTRRLAEQVPQLLGVEEPRVAARRLDADGDKKSSARLLATAMVFVSACALLPAVLELLRWLQSADETPLPRWTYVVAFLGMLQLAYAVYLMQLPDWASVWAATVFSLVMAATYAALLCLTLLSNQNSHVIQVLELSDHVHQGQATGWSVIMLGLTCLLAYFGGRLAARWQNSAAHMPHLAS